MKNLKKAIAKIMIFSLMIVMIGNNVAYANKVFSDVPHNHWAIKEINKMNNLGIITGMTNDEYRPNFEVPVSQAVVMMVRMLQPNRTEINKAMGIHRELLLEVGVEAWALDEMAYGLYKGIITEDELRSAYVDGKVRPAEKLEIVKYLTRALGLEEEAKNKEFVILNFNDIDEIPEADRGYVSMMVDIGVIHPYGDVLGNFNPKDTMTRAMMAKVLSVAYDHQEEKRQEEFNKKNKKVSGTIEDIKYGVNPSLTVKDTKGNIHSHDIKSDVKITRGTNNQSMLDLKVGSLVEVTVVDDLVTNINISDTLTIPKNENVEGVITSITITNRIEIHIKDDHGIERSYKVSPHHVTLLDQKNKSILDLRSGYYAKLTIVDDEVVVIFAETKEVTTTERYTGTVEFIDKDLKAFIIRPEANSPMRIDTTVSTTYINLIGNESNFNAIKTNSNVTVLGTYVNGKFVANTVVITE